jgi:(1->4)-alpha-D-glucan 1-alpha-D-glucosylmutase
VGHEPRATYRVQLHAGFTFDDAAALADYLRDLGVSHLYCSPYLQAAPGSTHGYDVVDHAHLNVELGGAEGHARLAAALHAHGLGQIVDVVPNHMAVAGRDNAWWWDVLENGPASRYAAYFDIDWDPPEAKLRHTVLVPILGDHYGRVLEAHQLALVREASSFVVRYHEHAVPVSPRTLDELLMSAARAVDSAELASIATALGRLPPATATDADSIRERHRDKEVLRARLARLCAEESRVAAAIDAVVAETNADVDRLHALLERQNYRLAHWRTAGRELDYRRFFDIATLVALRTERHEVFDDTHALLLELVRAGMIDGLRIDHPDGLRDPEGYFRCLRAEAGDVWVVSEKILASDEALRPTWPVAGTTGYDFLNLVGGLFVDPAGEETLTRLYRDFTGHTTPFAEVAWEAKQQIMHQVLAADVERLAAIFVTVCERHRRYRDYTRVELRDALRTTIAALPVYRTYVREDAGAGADDVAIVHGAITEAFRRRPDIDPELLAFLGDVLLLRHRGADEAELAMRFQQVSASVMAKGVEDTAFYRWLRLVALNEVGGDPSRFGTSVEEFHRHNVRRQHEWPHTMLATSTHDTKRSEDARLRIALLSEMGERWTAAVWRWAAMNVRHRRAELPDRGTEYLLYQTIVGAFPLSVERAVQYMEKATKEAKVHTAWIAPAAEYDAAVRAFVAGAVGDQAFRADVAEFVAPLVAAARVASLAQTLLKLTVPGIPDLYQGTELWDLGLVDPDNRRPVDYALRRRLLAEAGRGRPEDALARSDEGVPKLWLVRRALEVRRREPAAFAGDYEPLTASGERAAHVVGFVRGGSVAVVVPRLALGLNGDWLHTTVELPRGRWRDELSGDEHTGGTTPLASMLGRFPVALLRRG